MVIEVVRTANGAETGRWLGSSGRLRRVDVPVLDAYDPVFVAEEELDGQWRLSSIERIVDSVGNELTLAVCSSEATYFREPDRMDVEYKVWKIDASELEPTVLEPVEERRWNVGLVGRMEAAWTSVSALTVCGLLLATCLGGEDPRFNVTAPGPRESRLVRIDEATYAKLVRMHHPPADRRGRSRGQRPPPEQRLPPVQTGEGGAAPLVEAGDGGSTPPVGGSGPLSALPSAGVTQIGRLGPDVPAWFHMCRSTCGRGPAPADDVLRRDLDNQRCTCTVEAPL